MPYTPPNGDDVELIFGGAYTPPAGDAVELNFDPPPANIFDATIVAALDAVTGTWSMLPPVDASIDAALEDAAGSVIAVFTFVAVVSAALDDAGGEIAAEYDPQTWRGLWHAPADRWAADADLDAHRASGWAIQSSTIAVRGGAWQDGQALPTERGATWAGNLATNARSGDGWDAMRAVPLEVGSQWRIPPVRSFACGTTYEQAAAFAAAIGDGYTSPAAKSPQRRQVWDGADGVSRSWCWDFGAAAVLRSIAWHVPWGVASGIGWEPRWNVVPPPPAPPPAAVAPDVTFACRYPAGGFQAASLDLIFMTGGCPFWTPSLVYTDGAILVHNDLSVTRVSDNADVPVTGVSLQLYATDWCWGATLQLSGADAMALVSPLDGDPIEVQISLNGYLWNILVEDFTEDEVFGKKSYSAAGRSTNANLAAPTAPIATYTNDAQMAAAQLIDRELLNTGWTAEYHANLLQLLTIDWLVPAGAFTYQDKTPMDAISQVAAAIGARAYAHRNQATIVLTPKYPVSAWDWETATPDATIDPALMTRIGTRLQPKPDINQVVVSGMTQGVLVTVRRDGTAGELAAPMVTDALITHVDAGRERGRNVLCDTGKQALVSITLPLAVDTGLLEPGLLVDVQQSPAWRGVVMGITVAAKFGAVTQTVEIERHYA
jgi:hypothetical protein